MYLRETDERRLNEIADREGLSRADVIRAAIAAYALRTTSPRKFALQGCVERPDVHAAEIPEEELLRGFGE